MLRPHQETFNQICQSINNGSKINEVFVYAKPGSGKSAYCSIASQLIHDDNTKILWVCPRDSLITQAEQDFRGANLFDVKDMDIRAANNSGCAFRGTQGAVTSYQSVIADPERWIKISEKYKLILFLDEFDSLTDHTEWSKPIREIYNNSFLRVSATGTIDRSDNLPVSFVPYLLTGEIDFSETDTRKWIVYDTEQALKDGSILKFHARLLKGSGSYIDLEGEERSFNKFTGNGDQLLTAFKTGFAYDMFKLSVSGWNVFRKTNPWAKMLVISNNIEIAKEYTLWFKESGYRFEIATSEDSPGSKEAIKRFKMNNHLSAAHDGLVTVGQAYKGMNVPEATFLVFLTRIRGKSWCDQAIGRIQRRYKNKTCGFLYAPDDPKMRSILKKLACGDIEAADIYQEIAEKGEPLEDLESNEAYEQKKIKALSSSADHEDLKKHIQAQFIPAEHKEIQSHKEKRLRKEINSVINRIVGTSAAGNRKVKERIFWIKAKRIINKPLKEMSITELEKINIFAQAYK